MNALYYPFHLCHERTLELLLQEYAIVHFRDFMALRLTPFMGTTAFPDRMGDYYPQLLEAGRIIQGHNVSGTLRPEVIAAVDQDLADPTWRSMFHEALSDDYRFQRTLFDESDIQLRGNVASTENSLLSTLRTPDWQKQSYSVESVKTLSRQSIHQEDVPVFEYGWALVKASAALTYTLQLCHRLHVAAVTDSVSYHRLFTRSCQRKQTMISHACIKREGY
ncbi:MAG: hypothetical protein OXB94_10405 [Nitrospira sp.]|nr:hypothetical protein [Nitrospira sp.]